MEILQVWAYICKGIAGAAETDYGIQVTGEPSDPAKPLIEWGQRTSWGISIDAADDHPLIIISVSFEGAWLSEAQRGPLNQVVVDLANHLLFGRVLQPIQCFAYVGKGIGGASRRQDGIYVTYDRDNQPPAFKTWDKLSRWTLTVEAVNGFPPLTIFMYCEGELSSDDAWFYSLNQTAESLAILALFGQKAPEPVLAGW